MLRYDLRASFYRRGAWIKKRIQTKIKVLRPIAEHTLKPFEAEASPNNI
jgi:hypothetical protein